MPIVNESVRKEVADEHIDAAMKLLGDEIKRRLRAKGKGSFASTHELLGIINEEVFELTHAIWRKDDENTKAELMDIAVGCVFGHACIAQGEMLAL